jgi:isopenicillin N synthase-like dioxygenase
LAGIKARRGNSVKMAQKKMLGDANMAAETRVDAFTIPRIAVGPLFGGPSGDRDCVDRNIFKAATQVGFMTIATVPGDEVITTETRQRLLEIFSIDEIETNKLWRRKFNPSHANVYRGWFPAQVGTVTYKEGIDLGPDVAYGKRVVDGSDPLREATPMPSESSIPGWHAIIAHYYRAMERLAQLLMQSIARGLGLMDHYFDGFFAGGISTLRLLRYPLRPLDTPALNTLDDVWAYHRGERRLISGAAHVDSGFVTVLAQDGVAGLQAKAASGDWIDVPPQEGTLSVNFGKLLEQWTGGQIKATEHRVLGSDRERLSIPFFYEPRVDAEIAPLPLLGGTPFEPFLFGDYLWGTITKFVEFRGLEPLRLPRGRAAATTNYCFRNHLRPY